jgi:primary-amine oxidase
MAKTHPLEPLTASEIAEAVRILKANSVITPTTRIISIMLQEPPKSAVYGWPNDEKANRKAYVVLFDNGKNLRLPSS